MKNNKVTPETIKTAKFTAIIYLVNVVLWLFNAGMWFWEKYTYGNDQGLPFPMSLFLAITFGSIAVINFKKYFKMKKELAALN